MMGPLDGTMLTHRFRLDERIAAGGFGAIYRATLVASGHPVAIKVLHPEWGGNPDVIARFRREGATLTNLRHPHTVTTHEYGEGPDGTLYIVMELLRGESLFERFKSGPLPWRMMAAIARAICGSLGEAHALGIVHRDLKPANIHLEPGPGGTDFVKVLDFGIAKIMRGSELDDGSELTNVGQMIGTFDYMSPEQILGGVCHATSDIYTLGVIMYEMVGGVRPFAETPGPAMVAALLTSTPPALVSRLSVPPELDRIVMRCLEREPQDRYQSVAELELDLARLIERDDDAHAPTRQWQVPDEPVTPTVAAEPPPTMLTTLAATVVARPSSRFARGSQPAIPPDSEPGDQPTTIALPGGVWRTAPARPPVAPPHAPIRGSMQDIPSFDVTRATVYDAWVGRTVWALVIVIGAIIAIAVRGLL